MYHAYQVHHLMTLGIVGFSLFTHTLSSLPVLGMIYEAPVVLMNARELVYTFHESLCNFRISTTVIQIHWVLTFIGFVVARGGPSCLWIWSIAFWDDMLATLPDDTWYIYHGFAAAFTLLNIIVLNL